MPRFYFISVALHTFFFLLSGFSFMAVENQPAPIKVTLVTTTKPLDKDIFEGQIENLPKPKLKEKGEGKILSKFDSKAHSPERGARYRGSKTAIPREALSPAPPARKRSKKIEPAVRNKKSIALVSSLKNPKEKVEAKISAKRENQFADEPIDISNQKKEAKLFERGEKKKKEQRKTLSRVMTDKPDRDSRNISKVTGLPDMKTSSLDKYSMTNSGDVIDMGDEAVVSLSSKSFKYFDYFKTIREAVNSLWAYPEEAVIQGYSGRAMIQFTIDSAGKLEEVRLIKSSGYRSLDDEAQMAIKSAAPYKSFPATLRKKRLHIVATFLYQPTFSAIR